MLTYVNYFLTYPLLCPIKIRILVVKEKLKEGEIRQVSLYIDLKITKKGNIYKIYTSYPHTTTIYLIGYNSSNKCTTP